MLKREQQRLAKLQESLKPIETEVYDILQHEPNSELYSRELEYARGKIEEANFWLVKAEQQFKDHLPTK